jgi:hypothetical protein
VQLLLKVVERYLSAHYRFFKAGVSLQEQFEDTSRLKLYAMRSEIKFLFLALQPYFRSIDFLAQNQLLALVYDTELQLSRLLAGNIRLAEEQLLLLRSNAFGEGHSAAVARERVL